jgi:hypothetical protein
VDNKHNLVVATHTIGTILTPGAIALEAKENLGLDTVLVDKGYHNGRNAQCISNNISPPLLPILRQEQTKVLLNQLFGSSISVQQIRRYLHVGEILKPREDGTESGRTEQSGYQFKNTEHLQKLSSKPFMHQ